MAKKPSSSKPKPKTSKATSTVESPAAYARPEQQPEMRPDVGTRDRFRKT